MLQIDGIRPSTVFTGSVKTPVHCRAVIFNVGEIGPQGAILCVKGAIL